MIEPQASRPLVTVIGEALIDLVPLDATSGYQARPGGSPFNVAVGLARLGNRTALMARLADNTFGRMLRGHAASEGIDLTSAGHAVEPTTLAVVSLDATGQAGYDFYVDGTADWQWTAAETARLHPETAALHFGSIASWTAPGSELIHAAAASAHQAGTTLVSYDPNVRPLLLGEPSRARELIERSVGCAHLVKASRDDVEWLYPGSDIDLVATRWTELGALLVIITDGPDGAFAFNVGESRVHRPSRPTMVVDTVGAGDAFTAGLLNALVRRGFHVPTRLTRLTDAELVEVLDEAVLVSSMTCERAGADPPLFVGSPDKPSGEALAPADLGFRG